MFHISVKKITNVWQQNSFIAETPKNCIKSMPQRVAAVIGSEGHAKILMFITISHHLSTV